jgi:TetR/AcrR family transcriptional regulator, transcriptional repressor of bet genes
MKREIKKVLTVEARRNDLILGTLRSIEKYGYQNSTVQTICEESGVSRGLLGHYFESKDDLLMAAFQHLNAELDKEARLAVRAAGPDPFRRLVAAGLLTFNQERRYSQVTLHFWSSALANPKLLEHHRNLWARFRASVERLMTKAAADRNMQIDIKDSALMFTQLIDGLWLGWTLEKSYDLETCRRLVRNWICALFNEDPALYPTNPLVDKEGTENVQR